MHRRFENEKAAVRENREPFEYRKSVIRADQCRYSIELEV
jgi:hypothetical protein